MAEVPVLEPAEDAVAPGNGKKWLIIGVAAVVILAGAGAGAWFLMGQGNSHAKTAEKAKVPLAPAQYVALDPPFVVNFDGDQLVRFLQVTVQVMTRDPATVELLKANDPVVRNDLLLLFSNQKYTEVSTREGKERLRAEALKAVKHIIESAGGTADHVEQIFFTSFVMQ